MVFALDTTIVIWGVRELVPPGREDMVPRCVDLIRSLKERRVPIMFPSVAVAEYLAGFSAAEQKIQQAIISEHFFVAPFDMRAAAVAGELFDKRLMKTVRQETDIPRQCLKADLKIIATAIAHGATSIHADDKHFTSMACGRILVKEVPPVRDRQDNLPGFDGSGQSAEQ